MPFADVKQQRRAHLCLQRALAAGRVPHAYLFAGPPGVGKEMLAERLAARLLCESPREVPCPDECRDEGRQWTDACGRCRDCLLFAAGTHPDYHRIHRLLARSHPDKTVRDRKAVNISIEVIRHFLLSPIGVRPSRGRAKVFVVPEAERLSLAAQGAILKTLEEPPGHSFLILLAASADALLPTTRSRCQQVPFNPLPADFVMERLADQAGVLRNDAAFLAELAEGSLGQATRLAAAGILDRVPQVYQALAAAAVDPLGCGKALGDLARELADSLDEGADDDEGDTNKARRAQLAVLAIVATILRDVQRTVVGHPMIAPARGPQIRELASGCTPRAAGDAIRAVSAAEHQVAGNAHTGLIFDSLGISLGRALGQSARVG